MNVKEKYVVDEKGHKVGVLVDTKEYEKLLEYIEYMEDSLTLKEAVISEKEKGVTLPQYMKKLGRK